VKWARVGLREEGGKVKWAKEKRGKREVRLSGQKRKGAEVKWAEVG
jgi:hypothetical protein